MTVSQATAKVCVPIVCGEYMRATGFFYADDQSTYLVTAAHNIVPTTIEIRDETHGNRLAAYESTDTLPTVDIFLETATGWTSETIDVTTPEVTAIRAEGIDILLVEIQFDPAKHGYRVWTSDDLTHAETQGDQLEIIGYTSESLPSSELEYSPEVYEEELGSPSTVVAQTPQFDGIAGTSLYSVTLDETARTQYRGLSGAPVIGDGLVGIHVCDDPLPQPALKEAGLPETTRRLGHFRSKLIPRMLS